MAQGLPEKNIIVIENTQRVKGRKNFLTGKIKKVLHPGISEHLGCERAIYQQLKRKK